MNEALVKVLLSESGFIGVATLVVNQWPMPSLDPTNPSSYDNGIREKRKILRIVLWMGFSLILLTLAFSYVGTVSEGGLQRKVNILGSNEIVMFAANSQSCTGVKLGRDTIWQSFTDKKFFLFLQEQKQLKIVLNEVSSTSALLEVQQKNKSLAIARLGIRQSMQFRFEGCEFSITFLSMTRFRTGITTLFKDRYCAVYEVKKL